LRASLGSKKPAQPAAPVVAEAEKQRKGPKRAAPAEAPAEEAAQAPAARRARARKG
jgi:hypothetical protein